jgi:hypothetical protein
METLVPIAAVAAPTDNEMLPESNMAITKPISNATPPNDTLRVFENACTRSSWT